MKKALGLGLAAVLGLGAIAKADETSFETSIAVGYSHLSLNNSDRFAERDGVRVEPYLSINPIGDLPQLRFGFGVGVSGYTNELDEDVIITVHHGDEVDTFHADQWESLSLLEPEAQISWRQPLGDRFCIEPGCGIGAAIANYGVYDDWWDNEHNSEWDSSFMVRPFVRAAYHGHHWSAGLEVSYMFAGDMTLTDQVHGRTREFFAGGFFGYRW